MKINLTIDVDIEWFRKLNCNKMTTKEFINLVDDYVCNEIKEGFCENLPYDVVYKEACRED